MTAIAHDMRRNARWLIGMVVLMSPPYAISNRITGFDATEVPRFAFDDAIPFMPELAGLYLMLFPLMWVSVLVQRDPAHARRLVLAGTGCACVASLIFVFAPTSFARPDIAATGVYAWVITADTVRNACPSLHGAYAVYSALWIAFARGWRWGLAAALLGVAILFATIAVRQHGLIDLVLGGLLGGATYAIAVRLGR
jgi:membrane-associated phospholipid phosphatase